MPVIPPDPRTPPEGSPAKMPRWALGEGAPVIGPDVDAVCLVFSRDETQSLRIGRSVDDLMALSDDQRLRRQLAQGVFFSFDGWQDDPREVVCIPQCRQYLRELHAQWPYWLHFLAPEPAQWSVLLLCLASSAQVASKVPGRTALRVDVTEVRQIVQGMLPALNLLHQDMALDERQRQQIFERSMAAIQAVLA